MNLDPRIVNVFFRNSFNIFIQILEQYKKVNIFKILRILRIRDSRDLKTQKLKDLED